MLPDDIKPAPAFYHVLVSLDEKSQDLRGILSDLSEAQLKKQFVYPYRKGQDILCKNEVIQLSKVRTIKIIRTNRDSKTELEILSQKDREHNDRLNRSQSDVFFVGRVSAYTVDDLVDEGEDVTLQYIVGPPGTGALARAGKWPIIGVLTLLIACVGLYLNWNQRQLARQQLVGTQAAQVGLSLSMYPNKMLSVNFDHRTGVAAKEVRFVFSAVRKRLPSLEGIGPPISKTASESSLSKDGPYQAHEFALPGLDSSEFEALMKSEQTVKVEGEFSYDNGFGDVHKETVCQYWLTGIPNQTEGQGGANAFYPCEGFEARVDTVLKARRQQPDTIPPVVGPIQFAPATKQ